MLSRYLKSSLDPIIGWPIKFLPDHVLVPNIITLLGLFFSLLSGISFAYNHFRLGGIFILVAGILDMLDGTYSRIFNRASSFGAFFDSTADRYADMIILCCLGIHYSLNMKTGYMILTMLALIGSVMVSYTKSRAESIIHTCDIGLMERPERIILLAIGALTGYMNICLWILAILAHFTALQRILYTFKKTNVKGTGLKEVF